MAHLLQIFVGNQSKAELRTASDDTSRATFPQSFESLFLICATTSSEYCKAKLRSTYESCPARQTILYSGLDLIAPPPAIAS